MRWRNKFGVGHGSLSQNKEIYIETLLKFSNRINSNYKGLIEFLSAENISLIDGRGQAILGADYFFKFEGRRWDIEVFCTPCRKINPSPVKVFGHQFDSPDIFFMESSYKGVYTYRNFRRN